MSDGCFDQCVHIDITDDIIERAVLDEKNIKKQKGLHNASTINMSDNHDYIGSIAQNSVFRFFDREGLHIEKTPYFDKDIHKDLCDFEHRGMNDVKGSPTKGVWNEVKPYTSFLLSDHQREKVVDWYTFVKVDLDHNIAHIAGVINYYDFLNKGEEVISDKLKSPCHSIKAKDLVPFYKYAYGI